MRLLFVKHSLASPRASGHDVFCYHMMQSLAELGHEVSLATAVETSPEARAGLALSGHWTLGFCPRGSGVQYRSPTYLQRRFQSYWGIHPAQVRAVAELADHLRPHAVIAAGLEGPAYLTALRHTVRVWYAADEWVWHYLTQLRTGGDIRTHLNQALIKGLYERTHMPAIDRVWVVSRGERHAMRWIAGAPAVDVVPLGVDARYYRGAPTPGSGRTAIFWGRLDFGPNVQGLQWFCDRVWPRVRAVAPDAQFTIVGFNPVEAIQSLHGCSGIRVRADVPDLRGEVDANAVVVLPLVSGGGVKNKLLEAASMAKAILCTPRACLGLEPDGTWPLEQASSPEDWTRALIRLWSDDRRRTALGMAARQWVTARYSWRAAASCAVTGLEASLKAARVRRRISSGAKARNDVSPFTAHGDNPTAQSRGSAS